ncbi:MAG: T9SS type A sorting domain-containing protein [Saprospiraceae bacterium]|nr:T9SS type A sorting domain-containing protein [Saprospiraceae bacterium]MBP7679892.1 T9SS type A sorting domain-containing protein [Saprospiraceae bacterium]
MKNSAILGLSLASALCLLTLVPIDNRLQTFHTPQEMAFFKNHLSSPVPDSIYFPTVSHCSGCHGFDTLQHAMVNENGEDINVYYDWRSTMMANAAKDPFWRAKVSHEIITNPGHSLDIQTKCTSCHAPMGHYTAMYEGHTHYIMDDLLADTIGLDGVSCAACHMISADSVGLRFSGNIKYDTSRVMFGPYEAPFAPPMENFVGFVPKHSAHINNAGVCAPCHTLQTHSVDLNGNYTGSTFVEQATYHEWLNSAFSDPENLQTCQHCHIPRINDGVVISSNYAFLQNRMPFGLHTMVGGNAMMLNLMKNNKAALGIQATDADFDSTITATLHLLREKTIDLRITNTNLTHDTAFFEVAITNKAGHKFPSGYPSRRAFVQFLTITDEGDTLFQSGVYDNNYEVFGQDPQSEPHYDMINQKSQVQIYELVLGDVTNSFTTLLERSHVALKDNRLPPLGFTTTHAVYDTTRIYGEANSDSNFNKLNGVEGNGKDIVHYHVPLQGYTGHINVVARVYYQSLPPKWLDPMLAETSPEINSFRSQYNAADRSPILIKQDSINNIYVNAVSTKNTAWQTAVTVYPNPTHNGKVWVSAGDIAIHSVTVMNGNGQVLLRETYSAKSNISLQLPNPQQVYWIVIETELGKVVRRIVKID